ncbi:transposase [Rubrivivax sp. A210]|uniref:transposase n=1 Tax=Rubrivivax sp. A210 TaxID=2772301 RepID=UPI0019190025|nr:transposase [Rubrivivax sp. A210]CAD5372598.1 transposase [Rubrivivax sp. A210]
MARLARLAVAGETHLVLQRGHNGARVFADGIDRAAYLAALREAAAVEAVQVHAYALLDDEVRLLLTPPLAEALGRLMQAVGRRYVAGHNRRHGRSGTLWDGRYRCGVVEPGPARLDALRWIDGASAEAGSAAHRTGAVHDALLSNPPEYWQLGNTPFDREVAWRALLAAGLPQARAEALRHASNGGWAAGSAAFAANVAEISGRPARPRARGRPPRPGA